MRIAFDGTTLRPARTGVGYYSEHLLHHVAATAGVDEVVVVSNRPVETTAPLPAHVTVRDHGWSLPRLVWLQTSAARLVRQIGADVAHFTNGMMPLLSTVPTVVTIHDMSLTLFPDFHPIRRVLLNRPLVDVAARRADAVITVSESAKRDIVRLYNLAADRVHVVHEAPAPAFKRATDATALDRVKRTYGLGSRVILYVGTIEPRKNLAALLDAYAERHHAGDLPHQLVCAGPYGWLSNDISKRIERLGIQNAVRFTGYVPFEDLPILYSLAEIFVFPSLYEGFGLPVVEAMACGTPVVTGRTSSLTEIAGGAIEHAESLEPQALGDALVRLAQDRCRREECSFRGLERASAFSWDRAARETCDVYHHAIERHAGAVERQPEPALPLMS
jgi:glycosyltransferase involved in cell wall biosynthesis